MQILILNINNHYPSIFYLLSLFQYLNIGNQIIIILKSMNNPWNQFYSPFMDQFSPYSYLPIYAPPPMLFGTQRQQFSSNWVGNPRGSHQVFGQFSGQNEQKMFPSIKKGESNDAESKISPKQQKQGVQQDEEYEEKGQKSSRNLRSNAIKLFLKFLRGEREYVQQILPIILSQHIQNLSPSDFYHVLDQCFPLDKTYIRPVVFISFCKGAKRRKYCPEFPKALRCLFRHFLKIDGHQLWFKRYQCNRKMLNTHLEAGRQILKQLNMDTPMFRYDNR